MSSTLKEGHPNSHRAAVDEQRGTEMVRSGTRSNRLDWIGRKTTPHVHDSDAVRPSSRYLIYLIFTTNSSCDSRQAVLRHINLHSLMEHCHWQRLSRDRKWFGNPAPMQPRISPWAHDSAVSPIQIGGADIAQQELVPKAPYTQQFRPRMRDPMIRASRLSFVQQAIRKSRNWVKALDRDALVVRGETSRTKQGSRNDLSISGHPAPSENNPLLITKHQYQAGNLNLSQARITRSKGDSHSLWPQNQTIPSITDASTSAKAGEIGLVIMEPPQSALRCGQCVLPWGCELRCGHIPLYAYDRCTDDGDQQLFHKSKVAARISVLM
nr:hypothetical protein CFP56_03328 [Quercus suber]